MLLRAVLALLLSGALARPGPQWAQFDPAIDADIAKKQRDWITRQKRPDNPNASCCGEADLYWADKVEVIGDEVYVTITDTRPDAPLGRRHIPLGTRFKVPPQVTNDQRKDPSPLEHIVVFINYYNEVICFLPKGAI